MQTEEKHHSPSSPAQLPEEASASEQHHPRVDRGFRFHIVFAGLLLAALLTWFDGGTISTALPTIAAELRLGPAYVWVADSYFLTTAATQPLFSQLSDLWGRRWIFILAVSLFVLGSGLAAGANSAGPLIAGRAVQGTGAGGINLLVDLVVCDLVPLRERGKYMGLIFGVGATISAVSPLIAGALTQAGPGAWRYIFWINLPLGGACIVVMLVWFHAARPGDDLGFLHRLRTIDWIGTVIVVGSSVSVLWALAYGGSSLPWSDGRVAASLAIGLVGLVLFAIWEGSPYCRQPLTPLRVTANRTSAVAYFLTFTNAMLIFWVVFLFPLYFQSVLGVGARESGLWLLPFAFVFPFFAALSGNLMTRFGRYRPLHLLAFGLCTVAYGLCSILGKSSHPALWVIFQIILAISIALPVATLLPAVQAPLLEQDAAASAGAWAFSRSYGSIFGAAVPAAVFNSRFMQLVGTIDDPSVRAQLSNGQAYSQASPMMGLDKLSDSARSQVVAIYNMSIQRAWQIGVVFAGVSFLLVFLEKEISLRQSLDTAFGLEKDEKKATNAGQDNNAEGAV
ncbi:major facilitator superfamily domain-containing protein [Xylariaceae sp. FL0594]|nr:major facilitator superfamily domain-containing protein [Xylariaceae sp. FL0594]